MTSVINPPKLKKGDIVIVNDLYHFRGRPRLRYEVRRVYKTMVLLRPVSHNYEMTYPIYALEKEV